VAYQGGDKPRPYPATQREVKPYRVGAGLAPALVVPPNDMRWRDVICQVGAGLVPALVRHHPPNNKKGIIYGRERSDWRHAWHLHP
jgi:hypothetical protein